MYTELQAQEASAKLLERTVQHFLDIEWHIEIQNQLAVNPAGIAYNVEPALLGQYMAERGEPCEPLAYGYRSLADCEAFCLAYRDTSALWAETVQRKNDELDADTFDYDGALQELIDGREDEDFWRKGNW